VASEQLEVVERLEQHVAELGVANALVRPLEARLDRLLGTIWLTVSACQCRAGSRPCSAVRATQRCRQQRRGPAGAGEVEEAASWGSMPPDCAPVPRGRGANAHRIGRPVPIIRCPHPPARWADDPELEAPERTELEEIAHVEAGRSRVEPMYTVRPPRRARLEGRVGGLVNEPRQRRSSSVWPPGKPAIRSLAPPPRRRTLSRTVACRACATTSSTSVVPLTAGTRYLEGTSRRWPKSRTDEHPLEVEVPYRRPSRACCCGSAPIRPSCPTSGATTGSAAMGWSRRGAARRRARRTATAGSAPAAWPPRSAPTPTRPEGPVNGPANTNIIFHAKRLLALVESGLPTAQHGPRHGLCRGLRRLLASPMTAHPHRDPVTGGLAFFGYDVFGPRSCATTR